jgi:Ca2+-transporting ATPase
VTTDLAAGAVLEGKPLQLLQLAGLASPVRPVDPMDRAVRERLAATAPLGMPLSPEPVRTWPLRPDRLAVVQAWTAGADRYVIAAKGAPETVATLCRMSAEDSASMMAAVDRFAGEGLRMLGVGSCEVSGGVAEDPAALPFRFAGLVGFIDPLRPDASPALEEARLAGVSVIMITGDHPATALAIARAAGIDASGSVLTGREVERLPLPSLREQLRHVRVFARVAPEQKLLLVEALKANGEVVVMTGDGVNDAPALQAAHIGVAMGRKGTDVAREAAALVLLDDSFASIVAGVRLGRRIFANLRRALTYVTAIHVPIAGLALLPILLGLPPMLFPMHVVLLELAIDPLCALVFEGEPSEVGAMRRPPRRADEALFGLAQLGIALAQGGVLLAVILGLYVWALAHASVAEARGAAFAALVLGNLSLALVDALSSASGLFAPYRRPYWLIAGTAVLLLGVAFALPLAARMFQIAPPPTLLLAAATAAILATSGSFALLRLLRERVLVASPR